MSELMNSHRELFNDEAQMAGERWGTPIDKGVALNLDFMEAHEKEIQNTLEFWSAYPDLFLDQISVEGDDFSLFFYQRIFLRAAMRYKEVFVCAARAFSKSFLSILAMFLQCVFIPGTHRFIYSPHKNQSAKIAKPKIIEIYQHWPLLRKEVVGWEINETPGNFGKDYIQLKFRNGSIFEIIGEDRGVRAHGGLFDEIAYSDEKVIQEVVMPMLNVSRRGPDNLVNPKEPQPQQIMATSAGTKSSYAYERLVQCLIKAIVQPEDNFVMGCDYRVPALHGLITKSYIEGIKMDPSFNEDSFSREYLSNWSAASDESWFNFDKLEKLRRIKNPDWHARDGLNANQFYLLSVDVGRLHDQSVVSVFRVSRRENGQHLASLVNMIVIGRTAETKTFSVQALDIKKIIEKYDAREVVIDCNGLGVGLADEMIKEQVDEFGKRYPAYGFFNNDDYKKVQPKNAIPILYSMKANSQLKSKINGNAYARTQQGLVRFLIKEQEARSALLATQVGQKMSTKKRVERLMPHEMTTKLFLEMANLRLKATGTGDIVLEPINAHYPDDKYYSFAYGLWRVKELEEDAMKVNRRRGSSTRKLVFYN